MAVQVKALGNSMLSSSDLENLNADEDKIKTGGYEFIWGFVTDEPLQNDHFHNEGDPFSLFYFTKSFKKYILIKDLNQSFLLQSVIYTREDGSKVEGNVGKILLTSKIKYQEATLKNGKFQLSSAIDIAFLSNPEDLEETKDSSSTHTFTAIKDVNGIL